MTMLKIMCIARVVLFIITTYALCKVASDADDEAERMYREYDMNETDIVTYCDIYKCEDCPRYGDDCDGNGEE